MPRDTAAAPNLNRITCTPVSARLQPDTTDTQNSGTILLAQSPKSLETPAIRVHLQFSYPLWVICNLFYSKTGILHVVCDVLMVQPLHAIPSQF